MSGKTLGLIVNPVAGIGGRVGLKGSDGPEIQQRARELGAVPESTNRAVEALKKLEPLKADLEIVTYPGEMGEDAVRACGFSSTIIGTIRRNQTTPEDTQNAAREMRDLNVDLILFAGGDGTARDVCTAVGDTVPVLGIPAGVKIHSAVYAINPVSAGDLAVLYLRRNVSVLREAEVMDLDEAAYRLGVVSPQLYGYLKVPFERRLVQSRKSPGRVAVSAALDAIALDVIDHMQDDFLYIVGPGTTTRPILSHLGLAKTLIGVDVIKAGILVAADANEVALLELLGNSDARIVVTPIGGQGYIFGRGNQQISPVVIEKVGREHIIIVSATEKIHALRGRPLLVDTGDIKVDRMLSGYMKVITGYNERIVYRVSGGYE